MNRWSSVQTQQSLRQLNRNQGHFASAVRCVAGGFCSVLSLGNPCGRGLKRDNHFPCESGQIGGYQVRLREACDRQDGIARPREKAARHARALRADRVSNMCRHQTAFLRRHVELPGHHTTCVGL